jgi:transcriptional regulator with XRE-family HTH domain
MSKFRKYNNCAGEITISDILLDICDVNRCGLTRREIAEATGVLYKTVTDYINGTLTPHWEWVAMLGLYAAEKYRDYRIAQWLAERSLPREMWVERESDR